MVPRKGRHTGAHPIGKGVIAQIGPPLPRSDGHPNRVVPRMHPHRPVPDKDQGADVTGIQPIHTNRFHDGLGHLLLIVRHDHHADVRRVE